MKKKSLVQLARTRVLWLALATLAAGTSAAQADDKHCYTLASIKGTYTVIGTYGANVAIALAVRHFDGQGNLTGTFLVNEPDPTSTTGGRKLVSGTQMGTYTVDCDGTGVITRTLTTSTGVVTVQHDDFVITRARLQDNSQLLATELVDAQETPSAIVAGGIFLTRSYTRRPD